MLEHSDQRSPPTISPGASNLGSKIVDFCALKLGVPTFKIDAIDAFWQVPETEEIYSEPPPEYLAMLEAEGKSTDIVWRMLHQLPGKRKAAGGWADFFAGASHYLINCFSAERHSS